jgi:predicted nucleic acid-binding protein
MAGSRPTYCWDTSVLIAWITNEIRPPGEMEGVHEYVSRIDAGRAALIASVIVLTEMLDANIGAPAAEKLRSIADRSNVQLVDVTPPIAQLASEVRNYYQLLHERDSGGRLTTPDAIHLATALTYGVDEFNTFDDGQKGRENRGLLGLGNTVADRPLVICKPQVTQLKLPVL